MHGLLNYSSWYIFIVWSDRTTYWCFIWKGWLITLFGLYGYSSSFALKKFVVNAIKTFGDMNGIYQHRSDDSCMVTIILSPLVVYTALTGAHYCMCSVYTVAMSRYTYVTLHIKCLQFKTITWTGSYKLANWLITFFESCVTNISVSKFKLINLPAIF